MMLIVGLIRSGTTWWCSQAWVVQQWTCPSTRGGGGVCWARVIQGLIA